MQGEVRIWVGSVPATGAGILWLAQAHGCNERDQQGGALIESAWSCRHLPSASKLKHYVHERVSSAMRDIDRLLAGGISRRVCSDSYPPRA